MSVVLSAPPEQGQLVQVRQRFYVATEVSKSALPDEPLQAALEPQHLVTLSSVEDDALGEELQVVWEIGPDARAIEKAALPEPTGLDGPQRVDAFLDAVRWGASSLADTRSVQAPFRSVAAVTSRRRGLKDTVPFQHRRYHFGVLRLPGPASKGWLLRLRSTVQDSF